ncbi:MAG: GNAT family N-acetyltransferase [Ruminiclostridium sp.]
MILLAEETDAKELRDIVLRAFNDDYVLYGSIPPHFDSIEFHRSNIKSGMYYKITYENKNIGGIKLFDLGDGHFNLGTIYIDPDYQNMKIGTKAIKFIEELYPNVKKWSLDTPYKSFRNHYLYEKLGYVKVGEERPEQDKEFYLYLYEKCL